MQDRSTFLSVFKPSLVSGFLGLILSIVLTLFILYNVYFYGSERDLYTRLFIEQSSEGPIALQLAALTERINQSTIVGDIAVII